MPFEKNNKLGFSSKEGSPLDEAPLSIKLIKGDREKVRSIPDWQDKLRALIRLWVEDEAN